MSTPLSSVSSYATPAMLLLFKDARLIGDFVLDTGVREGSAALLTDPSVLNALSWASGQIESACVTGEKYTPTDLNSLTGVSQTYLQGLCCDLAFWKLLIRRYPTTGITEEYRSAMEALEKLRLGERIFGLQAQAAAGLPSDAFETQSQIDTAGLNTSIACRFYGRRGNVRRLNGGGSCCC